MHLKNNKKKSVSSPIDTDEIRSGLNCKIIGNNIIAFQKLTSTNEYAKLLVTGSVQPGTVIIAEEQTQGKGRHQRKWHSPPFLGLWFSIILNPSNYTNITLLPMAAGLAVAKAIEEKLQLQPSLKWPNDILLSGKKFCGILSDARYDGTKITHIIIGVGINVNQSQFEFTSDIKKNATSLSIAAGRFIKRSDLLICTLQKIDREFQLFENGEFATIVSGWSQRCLDIGKTIWVTNGGLKKGKFVRIDNCGRLVFQDQNGEQKLLNVGETINNETYKI